MYLSNPINSRLLESILESTSDPILLCDEKLVVLIHNQLAAQTLNLAREDLVGRALAEIFEVDRTEMSNLLIGRSLPQTLRAGTRHDRTRYFKLRLHFHAASDESIVVVALSGNPPTLRRSVQLLTAHAREGLFQMTNDHRLTYVNDFMPEMFGYSSASDMQNLSIAELFANEHAGVIFRQNAVLKKEIRDLRILFRRRNSSTFWGQLSWIPDQDEDGEIICGRIRDITELVSYENLLKDKADRLARTTEQLDTFLYHASHDLRAPITTMQGIIHLRKLEQATEDPYFNMINGCVDTLSNVLRQLTALSNNTSQQIEGKAVDFESILQAIFAELESHKNFKAIERIQELKTEEHFLSDTFRITLILKNVIKNAFDFRDRNKTSSMLSVTVTTLPDKAVIEIFDNGLGIPKAHVNKVFDLFYRASIESTGSGIGLYVAREAVRTLSGSIKLRSAPGIGTHLTIEIPNAASSDHQAKSNRLPGT